MHSVQLAARGDILVADPAGENFTGLVRVYRFSDLVIPDVLDAEPPPSARKARKP